MYGNKKCNLSELEVQKDKPQHIMYGNFRKQSTAKGMLSTINLNI